MDLEPHYALIVTHQLNDTPTGARTVPRLTIKVQKWAIAQFLEISTLSPEIAGILLPPISL